MCEYFDRFLLLDMYICSNVVLVTIVIVLLSKNNRRYSLYVIISHGNKHVNSLVKSRYLFRYLCIVVDIYVWDDPNFFVKE